MAHPSLPPGPIQSSTCMYMLHALLSSPHISLSKELEVVPEHGWEDEEVLDLGDLEEPVPVVEKVEPVQKLEGASSDQPKLVDP